jgi:two-component system chemotaxis sensor kinase CheA
LVPISTVTDGFSRVVRRVARDAGVEAELQTRGTDIRLDRDVLDRIGDPLVHLVRNAVDHGIEPPAERREAEKPETGMVEVRARREGDRATIEVRDDGRGLDPAAIRERAVEQGVVSAAEAADLSVPETYELVFEPGFSTADAVSETSGRGVGMDAVRQAVTDLNGTIEVESTRGEGTTVRLSVPVSVAVAEVVFVESGGRQYAVPTADVESIQRGSAVDAGGGTVAVRTPAGDREVPLVRLGDALGTAATGGGGDTGAVLRVDPSVREVALGCDAVGEKREVIITPYQDVLRGTPGIGGATLLDDNTVVNVIDVETL